MYLYIYVFQYLLLILLLIMNLLLFIINIIIIIIIIIIIVQLNPKSLIKPEAHLNLNLLHPLPYKPNRPKAQNPFQTLANPKAYPSKTLNRNSKPTQILNQLP